jgi:hypothetical protein
VAVRIRKEWLAFGLGAAVGLGLLLGWAWYDGGTRELQPISVPAKLPGAGQ